jgi:hypothetical protein
MGRNIMLNIDRFLISLHFKTQLAYNEEPLFDTLQELGFRQLDGQKTVSVDPHTGAPIDAIKWEHGDYQILCQNQRGVIRIESTDPEKGIEGMRQLMRIFAQDESIGLDLDSDVRFLETNIKSIWYSSKDWSDVMERFETNESTLFSDFIDDEIRNYSLRISPNKNDENENAQGSANHFDMSFTPMDTDPKRIQVLYVYRHKNINKVLEFNTDIKEKIIGLIGQMEE